MPDKRLDKFLADEGIGSRKDIKNYIKTGRVAVYIGDALVSKIDGSYKVDESNCKVFFDGEEIRPSKDHIYLILNKPAGFITATKDNTDATVLDLLKNSKYSRIKKLSPVGRLDKDTEGLLILTTDGELNHKLTSPKSNTPKTYFVSVTGVLNDGLVDKFEAGIDIGDKKLTRPARLVILKSDGINTDAEITVTEGRFHEVKRMFHACGHEVVYLKRIRMGNLVLPEDLETGCFRMLTKSEIEMLIK